MATVWMRGSAHSKLPSCHPRFGSHLLRRKVPALALLSSLSGIPATKSAAIEDIRAQSPSGDPWLLTPGPLTTSSAVKAAMMHDMGSREADFISLTARLRTRLLELASARQTHECVPLQGSGTFLVEAMLGCFVPPEGKVLVLINGAYGQRMASICAVLGRQCVEMRGDEASPTDVEALEHKLAADSTITHVALVHCETTSGVLNPLEEISRVVARHNRRLLVDAMSSFGAISIDARAVRFDALVSSANKCLQGVPGLGFCIAQRGALVDCKGNSPSLSLDLHGQWVGLESTGQWRFTPPTHCVLALDRALDELEAEGGPQGRAARYSQNCRELVQGMQQLGFATLVPPAHQASVIVTFLAPADPNFDFVRLHQIVHQSGYAIYPGKLTAADTFRIGCIGSLGPDVMMGVVGAIRGALKQMGVKLCAPQPPAR